MSDMKQSQTDLEQQASEERGPALTRRDVLRKTAWVVPVLMAHGVIVDDAVAGGSGTGHGKRWKHREDWDKKWKDDDKKWDKKGKDDDKKWDKKWKDDDKKWDKKGKEDDRDGGKKGKDDRWRRSRR
ncbi:hypothetical protein AWN76_008785 [Rhodothermaceae bacterium RA]|nr:hypothetical protein AWN76_008785 [Rhodothermaceae bacterium RA]